MVVVWLCNKTKVEVPFEIMYRERTGQGVQRLT